MGKLRFIVQLLLLVCAMLCSSNLFADNLKQLEDISVRVIGLEEVPHVDAEIIQLPRPELGELHDQLQGPRGIGGPVDPSPVVDAMGGEGAGDTSSASPEPTNGQ